MTYLKRLLALACCLSSLTRAYCQADSSTRNELIVSGGLRSGSEVIGMTIVPPGIYEDGSYVQTGHTACIFVTYRRRISKKVAVGITAGTQSLAYRYENHGQKYYYPNFSTKMNLTTIALEIRDRYNPEGPSFFEVYGLLGLGVSFVAETRSPSSTEHTLQPVIFNSQWTPLGFYLGKRAGAFIELGIGYKGLINGGLSYRF